MRSLHLTLMIFGQVILAAFILYSAVTSASPLTNKPVAAVQQAPVITEAEKAHQPPQALVPVVEQTKQEAHHAPSVPVSTSSNVQQTIVHNKADVDSISSRSAISEPAKVHNVVEQPKVSNTQKVSPPASESHVDAKSDSAKLEAKMIPVENVPQRTEQVVVHNQEPAIKVEAPESSFSHLSESQQVKSAQNSISVETVQVNSKVMDGKSAKIVEPAPVQAKETVNEAPKSNPSSFKDQENVSGKSQEVVKEPIVSVVSQEQVAKQPVTVAQAPVKQVQSFESVGVAEAVKKVEPVSASTFLVVQSPEPKITVLSRGEAQPLEATPVHQQAFVQPNQVPVQQVPVQQAPAPVQPATPSVVHSVPVVAQSSAKAPVAVSSPVVNGGLGPLHLLAATLCSYQPDKPVADDCLNALYSQRASVRKSLFDFMSLKFTNLEKFSSRLNAGLEIMPRMATGEPGVVPSHGWPVVGKCTAHDLKLMAEAAWCETPAASSGSTDSLDKETPTITSNHHRAQSARALDETVQTPDQSSVISKILHVSDIKDAPIVESSIANLNLTQQQLADIQAQATSTRVCRRNALKMTKALFNHLAEEQKNVSDSWPQLYSQMASDDCARKRMIDIVNALAMFRTDSTSIRRDNVEFAFAMDDLRSKVLDSEVNVPLTFDKQFIEVEQFLQQSVKLMLSNIDPERAKLTSMRYRSLMPGPLSADDQCIELHQRLLAKNYPTDCNPTQFGQLPDVLRMAASSLELWSIENELSKRSGKIHEYPTAHQPVKQDVNECIANLVAS